MESVCNMTKKQILVVPIIKSNIAWNTTQHEILTYMCIIIVGHKPCEIEL